MPQQAGIEWEGALHSWVQAAVFDLVLDMQLGMIVRSGSSCHCTMMQRHAGHHRHHHHQEHAHVRPDQHERNACCHGKQTDRPSCGSQFSHES